MDDLLEEDLYKYLGTQNSVIGDCLEIYNKRIQWGYLPIQELSVMSVYYPNWVKNLYRGYEIRYGVSCGSLLQALVVLEPFLVADKDGSRILGEGISGRDNTNDWVTYKTGDGVITRVDVSDVHIIPLVSMYCAFKALYEFFNRYSGARIRLAYGVSGSILDECESSEIVAVGMCYFSLDDIKLGVAKLDCGNGDYADINMLGIEKIFKL